MIILRRAENVVSMVDGVWVGLDGAPEIHLPSTQLVVVVPFFVTIVSEGRYQSGGVLKLKKIALKIPGGNILQLPGGLIRFKVEGLVYDGHCYKFRAHNVPRPVDSGESHEFKVAALPRLVHRGRI